VIGFQIVVRHATVPIKRWNEEVSISLRLCIIDKMSTARPNRRSESNFVLFDRIGRIEVGH
jgi:hypothetical protein